MTLSHPTSRLRRAALGALTLLAATAAPAAAEGWVQLPNGEWGFAMDYATTGFFTCFTRNIAAGSCAVSADGSSITLSNGGSALTLTYHGAGADIVPTNVGQRADLGHITQTLTGDGPFIAPDDRNRWNPIFLLAVRVETTYPFERVRHFGYDFLLRDGRFVGATLRHPSYFSYRLPDNPDGPDYPSAVFSELTRPVIRFGDQSTLYLEGSYGVVPEPATIALLGTGLLGLGVVGLRRRR